MDIIQQSIARRVLLKLFLTGTSTAATGKTLAVVISKNGSAFGNPSAGATTGTEIGSGWYYYDSSTTDTGTLGPWIVRGTCSGCDDSEAVFQVGVTDANITQSLGVAVVNSDFTIASATTTTVTLPTTYTDSTALPDDARYIWNSLQVVSGTGQGQIVLLTTATNSARQYNVFAGTMPIPLDSTSKCIVIGPIRSNASLVNVTVGSNLDKVNYTLAEASLTNLIFGPSVLPTNFGALAITSGGIASADIQTVKTQTVTCAASVTVGAFVGNATHALVVDGSGFVAIANPAVIWDLSTIGHTTSGTFGAAMAAAGSSGDPWSTSLPGSYGAGTAGFIVGTNAWTTAMTESYAADGVAPTPSQSLFMLMSYLFERNKSGTTLTTKRLNGSTTSMTFTLDNSTTPNTQTRTT